ncbi:hypothetical protein DSO57_1032478 [Entomophthora muscae]|uniref:Uncharacterized protein n=1 Tax=Entomophthora muscae TaxID=34485 RepID=A0ACC2SPN2_9FUNG|nr:hypothetical protein DSO57_1032478 [Entomophthora muscae]
MPKLPSIRELFSESFLVAAGIHFKPPPSSQLTSIDYTSSTPGISPLPITTSDRITSLTTCPSECVTGHTFSSTFSNYDSDDDYMFSQDTYFDPFFITT